MKYLKIFTDFREVVEPLSDEERGRLFTAMLGYALDGTEPALTGNERFLWTVARQHIDREIQAYDDMVEARREAGRRGASARWQKEAKDSKNGQDKDKDKDKEKENDNDKEKDKEREYRGAAPPVTPASAADAAIRTLSMPPSLEEIESYCQERGNRVNAQRFRDFYTANGWRVGKNPMRDWKAAVRSWESNGMDQRTAPAAKPTVRDTFLEVMEKARLEEAKLI